MHQHHVLALYLHHLGVYAIDLPQGGFVQDPVVSAAVDLALAQQQELVAEPQGQAQVVDDHNGGDAVVVTDIPDNLQLSASQRRMVEVFEDIAKEGRKFGVTLFPATQRPSELNRTIIAQCANIIVGKLNNENDKALIKGMLPDGDEKLIDAVTMFHPGEVLVIGDAVPIPLKIKVELAKERPVSRTINFWDVWGRESACDIPELVDRYLQREEET